MYNKSKSSTAKRIAKRAACIAAASIIALSPYVGTEVSDDDVSVASLFAISNVSAASDDNPGDDNPPLIVPGISVSSPTPTPRPTPTPVPPAAAPSKNIFKFKPGQTFEWKGEKEGLPFDIEAPLGLFGGLVINGKNIASDNYTVSGNTVVTLSASYLSTLGKGVHTFRAIFGDGYAETTFTVK